MILAPGLIWGASFLFIAEALRALGPSGITFTRIAIGFAALARGLLNVDDYAQFAYNGK